MPAVLIRRGAFIAHRPRQSSVRNECAPDIVAALGRARSVGWGVAAQIVRFPRCKKITTWGSARTEGWKRSARVVPKARLRRDGG